MLPYIFLKIFPDLKKDLKIAHIRDDPRDYIRKMMMASLYLSVAVVVFIFFIAAKKPNGLVIVAASVPAAYLVSFIFLMQYPKVMMRQRQKEIDREVLFAGRYLLVKIESGIPLFNALTDASKSYGVMPKYFKEITDDIMAGMPIEEALESAREYSASKKFKKILAELVTSLRTGVDVGTSLHAILQSISNDQLLEIKDYSKKLNAYIMIYMILAVVVPSLGMTMLVVVAAFLSLELSLTFILIATGVLVFIQLMFINLFKSIRPNVNL